MATFTNQGEIEWENKKVIIWLQFMLLARNVMMNTTNVTGKVRMRKHVLFIDFVYHPIFKIKE